MKLVDDSILFVVNPHSDRGRTGDNWPKTYKKISQYLEMDHDYRIADGIGEGIKASEQGIKDGFNRIVAVGGDGTTNEVVNGIFNQSNSNVLLGFLKAGTVNDYLTTISYPKSLTEQLDIIQGNDKTKVPLVKVSGDTTRVCLNIADLGVSAIVAHMASVERRLLWVPGVLRYHLLALRGILKWKNIPASLTLDNRSIEGDLSLLMAGFSYTVGTYRALPHADPFGNKFAYTVAMDFSKLRMIRMMPVLKKGDHTEEISGIYIGHASKIMIKASDPLVFEVDGEPFSYNSKTVELEALPNRIVRLGK